MNRKEHDKRVFDIRLRLQQTEEIGDPEDWRAIEDNAFDDLTYLLDHIVQAESLLWHFADLEMPDWDGPVSKFFGIGG